MPYIGRGSDFGVRSRFIYTATAGQTTFSGNDDAGITLAYTDTLYMDVYQNGVLLVPATDYAASTGTSVVLVQGASVGDTVEMVVYDIFSVADSVSAKDGGSFAGNVGMGGTLSVTGVLTGTSLDISGNIDVDGTTNLDVVDIDGAVDMASTLVIGSAGGAWNGAANGRDVTIHGGSETVTGVGQISIQATDAFGADLGGGISFGGEYSAADNIDFATLWGRKENATDDNTAGYMQLNTRVNGGNMTERMRIDSSGNVGIGTTSFGATYDKLAVAGGINIQDDNNAKLEIGRYSSGVTNSYIKLGANSTTLKITNAADNADLLTITNSDGAVLALGTIGGLGSYNNTTGSAANAHLLSSGVIVRSTSSRRYKNTIEDATHGLKEVLTLRPVTYKGNNDGDTLYGGLIAEEVHDAGLTEFVEYNEDKEPDALQYSHMVSLCIKAIQELSAKNDALEARLAALEAK